jgi:hypothetical protein
LQKLAGISSASPEPRVEKRFTLPEEKEYNITDEMGLVRNDQDIDVKTKGLADHAFNLLISNRIGGLRRVPDTRNKL